MEEPLFREFDEWVQDAADRVEEPPYNEENWRKMELLLDSKQRRRIVLPWLSLLFLILALVCGWYWVKYGDNEKTRMAKSLDDTQLQPHVFTPSIAQPDNSTNSGNAISRDEDWTREVLQTQTVIAAHALVRRQIGERYSLNPSGFEGKQADTESGTKPSLADVQDNLQMARQMEAEKNAELPITKANASEAGGGISGLRALDDGADATTNAQTDQGRAVLLKADKAYNPRSWFVQPSLGPEWSMTPGGSPGKASLTMGIIGGYNFSERFGMQAGLFAAAKLYDAYGSQYKFEPGSYYTQVKVNEIEANCRVWEIPVSASYVLHAGSKQRFTTALGFNNTIMQSEVYDIYYTRLNGNPGYAKRAYSTGKLSMFSGLEFSLGYRRQLGRGFELTVDPQAKLAIRGAGEGNVKFHSFGILTGLRYYPAVMRRNK